MLPSYLVSGLLFVLPAYLANSIPTLLGGKKPVDLGRRFLDGKRIFGDHKTWQGLGGGLTIGICTGVVIFLLAKFLFPHIEVKGGIGLFDSLYRALLLSIGTHVGDLAGSFIKRRLKIDPGDPFPVFDQIGFFIFAILVASPFYWFGWLKFVIWLCITLVMHPLTNFISWLVGIQEEIF